MERPENNKWLDEALTETIGSEKPRTDFEQWKQQHPFEFTRIWLEK